MRNFEKDLIFWYGLHKIAGDDMKLHYLVSTEKEYLFHLANITFYGLQQYTLYSGDKLTLIDDTEYSKFSDYIIDHYELLYRVRFRYYTKKVTKLKIQTEEQIKKAKEVIVNLLIPYFNKHCFKTFTTWKHIVPAYIAGMIFNFEYDINYQASDKKLKTSMIYPFLYTLNIINIQDRENLFKRIRIYFDRKKIIKKYESGRSWKTKEKEYLSDTMLLLNNEEEWNTFVSNFALDKWDTFNMEERYKSLFQLSKIICILMKDKITSVTMLGNGVEQYDLLESYLPLFIYSDKIVNESGNISMDVIEKYGKTCTPFSTIYLSTPELWDYVVAKETHLPIDEARLSLMVEIIWTILLKLRITKLNHLYLPDIVNLQIEQKKKLFVNILKIYSEVGEGKYKALGSGAFNIEEFYISDADIAELKNSNDSIRDILRYNSLFKISLGLSYVLGLNMPTAKSFDYDIFEIIKYIITILGPHPVDRTIMTIELMELIQVKFARILDWYSLLGDTQKEKYKQYFELPYRLYKMKQK
jgi:hypothetical protein